MAQVCILLTIFFMLSATTMAAYNIVDYGAKPNGQTDSSKALLSAWAAACGSGSSAKIYVPVGRFLVRQALFQGPCNNNDIEIYINGTLVAPSGYTSAANWLMFKYVQGLSVFGGTIDGRGQAFWGCKKAGLSCPPGATSLAVYEAKDVLISGLTSLNSEAFHITIYGSSGVYVQGATITAPGNSPNTDGVHIQMSSFVSVAGADIKTGDDCISVGEGVSNVWIERIQCGPGHGVSIGSLGAKPSPAGVQNVTVTTAVFAGTQNGLRIKTWGTPYGGFVKGVTFEHAIMEDVQNPIVIDQNYCPNETNCPGQSSGIKISRVSYNDIHGSSATAVAVNFDCSPTAPCSGIGLQDIKLTYQGSQAQAYCKNARGRVSGSVSPNCFGN